MAPIMLLRSGRFVVIEPTTPEIRNLLTGPLTYTERKFYRGYEAAQRRSQHLPGFETFDWQCYSFDHKQRLVTSCGMLDKIQRILKSAGYEYQIEWPMPAEAAEVEKRNATVYRPRWDLIDKFVEEGFCFRERQRELLEVVATHECGRVLCPTGWGKSTIIMLICKLYPKAKIDIVTKSCSVLLQRIYPELAQSLPSVGIIGGGKKITDRRVMCISADSLHHARRDADIVLVDEGHQACADKYSESLAQYRRARFWMFSASWDMRLDNKDMRAEALAGPIRMVVTYDEAEKAKIVVPVEIRWGDVRLDTNPCEGLIEVEKERVGIWANDARNRIIANDARRYGPEQQVLISVRTVEHGLRLKKLLPEFELVYSGATLSPRQLAKFYDWELIDDSFQLLDDDERWAITKDFETGKLKKAIATTVWNVGVNFKGLEVLIRADAGGSQIADTQIPGRASRTHTFADGASKKIAIVHDYLDQFDIGFRRKAQGRAASYAEHKWAQIMPGRRPAPAVVEGERT